MSSEKGHKINKTNTCLERRIKVIYYCETSNTMLPVKLCYQLYFFVSTKKARGLKVFWGGEGSGLAILYILKGPS